VFCRAFTDMRTEAWITAHVAAFEFFGGVPQILVPDNELLASSSVQAIGCLTD